MGFSQCFSHNWTVIIGFLSKITEVNAIFITYQGYTLSTRLLTVGVDLNRHQDDVLCISFSPCKVFLSPFPYCSLWKKVLRAAGTKLGRWGYAPLLEDRVDINTYQNPSAGIFISSPHLFMHSNILKYQYRLREIYFILSIII